MLNEILLAIIQAVTEFLPISSSGHLALFSNLISEPNLFLFVVLHLASLIAVLIFTRNEIYELFNFSKWKKTRKMWSFLIIGTIPAALFGYFFNSFIENSFGSILFLGIAFIFTGFVLLMTKFVNFKSEKKLNLKNAFIIGLFQVLALFPGVSRSGMTISSAMFLGIEKEKAAKFSFLLFIPLVLGAMVLEISKVSSILGMNFSLDIFVGFIVALVLSIFFLNLLLMIIRKEKFWVFSIYCFIVSIVSLIMYIV